MPRAKKQPASIEKEIYHALFTLVAREGWWGLTLPKLTRAAKMKLSELLRLYPDKTAALGGFFSYLDQQLAETGLEDAHTLRERLFEILMRRFELMRPYRPGLKRVLEDMFTHPLSALCFGLEIAPLARRSAKFMLDLAEFPVRPPLREAALVGLKLVYLHALRVWKDDESADLSSTMAALDRGLERYLSLLRLS